MLYLDYKMETYRGSSIDIIPQDEKAIPELRNMVMDKLRIQNPLVTLNYKNRRGEYEGVPDYIFDADADIAEALKDLWDGDRSMNVMLLLSRAFMEIVKLKSQQEVPMDDVPEEFLK